MDDQRLLRKLNRRTRFTQFLVWIALFFTAAGIAAGYKNWLRIHQKAKAGLAGIAEIREELPSFAKKDQLLSLQESVKKQFKDNSEKFDKTLKDLKQIQKSTEHIAETVNDQIEGITREYAPSNNINVASLSINNSWLLEVRFLLQTAIYGLRLRQDKDSALSALKLADKLLLKKKSAEFFPLRKQISQDIALIEEYKLPNVSALSLKITVLQEQLLVDKEKKKKDKNTDLQVLLENSAEEKTSIISRVKKTINEAVVVRKFDQPLHVKMSKETQDALFHLLALKLEALRIMLLQKQDTNYHKQINGIRTLLKKYYSEEDFLFFNKELDKLNSVNLTPEIPDISGSLLLLESLPLAKIKATP